MCSQCLYFAEYIYPDLNHHDLGHLLMSATCFPFGRPETVLSHLIEAKENTDGSLNGAIAYAERQLDEAMAEMKLEARKPK